MPFACPRIPHISTKCANKNICIFFSLVSLVKWWATFPCSPADSIPSFGCSPRGAFPALHIPSHFGSPPPIIDWPATSHCTLSVIPSPFQGCLSGPPSCCGSASGRATGFSAAHRLQLMVPNIRPPPSSNAAWFIIASPVGTQWLLLWGCQPLPPLSGEMT
eukprot:EG_transcript_19408